MTSRVRRSGNTERLGPVTPDRSLGEVLDFMRALWALNHALETTSRRMRTRLGVSGPERMVVRLVGRYPGISAGELAHTLHVHPSTLTGLLQRLTRRGVLRRTADAGDARRALFTLASKGVAIDQVRSGTVEAAVKAALASLARRDVQAAAGVLARLGRALEGKAP